MKFALRRVDRCGASRFLLAAALAARLAAVPASASADDSRSRLFLPPSTATTAPQPASPSAGAATSTRQPAKQTTVNPKTSDRPSPQRRVDVGSAGPGPASLPTPPPAYIPPEASAAGEAQSAAPSAATASAPRPAAAQGSPGDAILPATISPGGPPAKADVRVIFTAGGAELADPALRDLDALVDRLGMDSRNRVQLLAYARGGDERAGTARRLSLSRATAVRSYLVDRGIGPRRIDVRALGDRAAEEPRDRVDVVVTPP